MAMSEGNVQLVREIYDVFARGDVGEGGRC
jgi:hypothetical protein